MSRVVVLGGTGAMGRPVSPPSSRRRGHDVVGPRAPPGSTPRPAPGSTRALVGRRHRGRLPQRPHPVKRTAVAFFEGRRADRVRAAAERAGVGPPRRACRSSTPPTPPCAGAIGYYAGKAAQEEAYAAGPVPVTLVRTTAWFSLAETFLSQIRLGPRRRSSPGLRLRPVHPAAAAAFLADAVEAGAVAGDGAAPRAGRPRGARRGRDGARGRRGPASGRAGRGLPCRWRACATGSCRAARSRSTTAGSADWVAAGLPAADPAVRP